MSDAEIQSSIRIIGAAINSEEARGNEQLFFEYSEPLYFETVNFAVSRGWNLSDVRMIDEHFRYCFYRRY